jgi:hypothetical protein
MMAALSFALSVGVGAAPAASDSGGAFTTIAEHYHRIHEALVDDSLTDVSHNATAIARTADEVLAHPSAARTQVAAGDVTTVRELLPEVVDRARVLADCADLEDARAAMAKLTQPLTRWQRLVRDPKPVVAYCPMVRKAWLQDDGPMENPYDTTMLRCGSIVQR